MKTVIIALASIPIVAAAAVDRVESPVYASWARFPVGTTIVIEAKTESGAGTTTTTTRTRSTLIERTDSEVVVESVITSDATGETVENDPIEATHRRHLFLPDGVTQEDVGKPRDALDRGSESIELPVGTFESDWYDLRGQTEAGPSITRTWYSPVVPGRVLRSVTTVEGTEKRTTLELIELETP